MKPSRFPDIRLRPGESIDPFLGGSLRLIQSRNGYRFSIDAVLLSRFVSIRPKDVLVDLGTGCGIIPLLVLSTRPAARAVGLEIQPELAGQAARNAVLNGFGRKMAVIRGDLRNPPMRKACADVVTCNPPYRKARSGRINPDHRRAIARHEILADMDDILRAARHLLKKKGRLALVYPADRMADLFTRMRRFDIEPKRLQVHYPDIRSDAKLVLVEGARGARPGLAVSPPVLGQGDPGFRFASAGVRGSDISE